MSGESILVAGIGNIFLGDDAFGVEVAQRLLQRELPREVRVVDFGIRGIDLAYAMLDDYETVILVDVTCRGGPPGTLYVIEPELADTDADSAVMPPGLAPIEMHDMEPVKVLRLARTLGGSVSQVLLVGCEPETAGREEEDLPMGLSEPVQAAVPEAVGLIESLVAKLLNQRSEPVAE